MTSMIGTTGYKGSPGSSAGGNIIPKGHKLGQIQQFTPEQLQLFQSLFSQVSPDSYLSRLAGGDQSLFGEIEAPALRQFGQLQGQLGSRFSQLAPGALSSRGSSGFQNVSNQAASNFAQELQAQRQGLQRQAMQDLFGLSGQLFAQNPYQKFLVEKQQKQGGFGGLIGAGLGGLGGFFAGGPAGAFAGAQLGHQIGSSF